MSALDELKATVEQARRLEREAARIDRLIKQIDRDPIAVHRDLRLNDRLSKLVSLAVINALTSEAERLRAEAATLLAPYLNGGKL